MTAAQIVECARAEDVARAIDIHCRLELA